MNIEELKRLAEAATKGPWEYQKDSKDFPVNGYVTVRDCIYSVCVLPYEGIRTDDHVTDNGLFIAAANPAAILELIRQRDELLAALEQERKRLDWALKNGAEYACKLLWWMVDEYSSCSEVTDNPRATIDELIASAASAKAEVTT